jgi:hypothetical protein
MADPHIISALREKRATVAGLIEKIERKLAQQRANLTHIDGVLRLFQPDRNPEEIKPKQTYARRTRYFARNELPRLLFDVLRDAEAPVSTDDLAARISGTKGFDTTDGVLRDAVRTQAVLVLRSMRKRGTIEQTGLGRATRWKLVGV